MTRVSPEKAGQERPITTAGQLFVEGRVPEMFFREMIESCGLADRLEARTFGDISKDNLQAWLELFCQKPSFKERVKRLGIIRDAESLEATSAFQSVQAALQGARLAVPGKMNSLEGDPLAVGIFILPNCEDPGMLEGLCLTALAESEQNQKDAALPCVDEFFTCLNKRGRKPGNEAKAKLAGHLLACDVVDPQLGRAAQKGVIPWDAKAFDSLKAFLHAIAGK